MRHRQVHPTPLEGCWPCKLTTIAVAPSATPTRRAGSEVARINAADAALARDRDAYARLRADGRQPVMIDGCADLEQRASIPEHIDSGHPEWPESAVERATEILGHTVTVPDITPIQSED